MDLTTILSCPNTLIPVMVHISNKYPAVISHTRVFQNMYDLHSSVEHKRRHLKNALSEAFNGLKLSDSRA